jgi:hypothetical protein
LSLEVKRERIYDSTGEIAVQRTPIVKRGAPQAETTSDVGRVLRGYVWKFRDVSTFGADQIFSEQGKSSARQRALEQANFTDAAYLKSLEEKDKYKRITEAITGPEFNGFYEIKPANLYGSPLNGTKQNSDIGSAQASGPKSTIMSNEVLMITKDTVPYTDLQGYRHIGAFPYGANLRIVNGVEIVDGADVRSSFENDTQQLIEDEENKETPTAPEGQDVYTTRPSNEEAKNDENNKKGEELIDDPQSQGATTVNQDLSQ